jgi:hypothetical protein
MIIRKMFSPLLIAAALVSFPALSATADPDTVVTYPANAVAPDVTVMPDGSYVQPAPAQVSQEQPPVAYDTDALYGADYVAPSQQPVLNAANPLGDMSKVNPLLPSPG